MTVLEKIAFYQNIRNELPNQELARELADSEDHHGIAEIAAHLWDKNKNVRSDCLKVLYEIGYLKPKLLVAYTPNFLKLLDDKENRMVWGALIALATVADQRPHEIWQHIDTVIRVTAQGTVISVVWGIRAIAKVAAADPTYKTRLFPILLEHVRKCIPRDVPTHAESILCAVDATNKADLLALLESRKVEMTPAQLNRLKKVMRLIEKVQ
jgi:hypothetical protein